MVWNQQLVLNQQFVFELGAIPSVLTDVDLLQLHLQHKDLKMIDITYHNYSTFGWHFRNQYDKMMTSILILLTFKTAFRRDHFRTPLIIGNLFDTATSYSWAQDAWQTCCSMPLMHPEKVSTQTPKKDKFWKALWTMIKWNDLCIFIVYIYTTIYPPWDRHQRVLWWLPGRGFPGEGITLWLRIWRRPFLTGQWLPGRCGVEGVRNGNETIQAIWK